LILKNLCKEPQAPTYFRKSNNHTSTGFKGGFVIKPVSTFQVSKIFKKNSQQTKKEPNWSFPGFLNNNLKKTKGFSPWQKKELGSPGLRADLIFN
jgi:hypothetical protein